MSWEIAGALLGPPSVRILQGHFLVNYYRIFPSSLEKLVSQPDSSSMGSGYSSHSKTYSIFIKLCETDMRTFLDQKKVGKTTPKHSKTPGGANSKPSQNSRGRRFAL